MNKKLKYVASIRKIQNIISVLEARNKNTSTDQWYSVTTNKHDNDHELFHVNKENIQYNFVDFEPYLNS